MVGDGVRRSHPSRFSALQRAEIAEICWEPRDRNRPEYGFSALQRAEIAEINRQPHATGAIREFQCSSTSRNC